METIDDKGLDIKVAETEEEAFWVRAKEQGEASIKDLKDSLMFQEAILEMVKSKIKEE